MAVPVVAMHTCSPPHTQLHTHTNTSRIAEGYNLHKRDLPLRQFSFLKVGYGRHDHEDGKKRNESTNVTNMYVLYARAIARVCAQNSGVHTHAHSTHTHAHTRMY